MYIIIYLIIYTRAVSVSSVWCGGGVLGVVCRCPRCGVLPGVWWWCGGGVLGGVVVESSVAYIQPSTKAGTPRGSSVRWAVSLLNQGFWVEFTDAIALIINYLGAPFGCAFAEWCVG